MLWVFISRLQRGYLMHTQNMFLWGNKKHINLDTLLSGASVFCLITTHTPIRAQSSKQFLCLQITASVLFVYFFIKAYRLWVRI